MTLIDTSSLVHFLRRKGDAKVKERVGGILRRGDAAICDLIIVELWMGIGSESDARSVDDLAATLILLPLDAAVWKLAGKLAAQCRKSGHPVPSSDIVIASCAFAHGASLDAEDAHFITLQQERAEMR